MGEGVTIYCRCGFKEELSYGGGFLSIPRPETTQRTLEGKYGQIAKRVAEENPDAGIIWYRPLFHCSCGNLSVKDAVSIVKGNRYLYRPSMRCGICHKKMWEVESIPEHVVCPRCGSPVGIERTLLWD